MVTILQRRANFSFPIDFCMDISTCSATALPVIIYLPVLDESIDIFYEISRCSAIILLNSSLLKFFYSFTQE